MEPHEFSTMVKEVNEAAKIRGRVNYELKDIKKGEAFTKENVRCIRPGYGMKPKYYEKLLNSLSEQEYKKGQPIINTQTR